MIIIDGDSVKAFFEYIQREWQKKKRNTRLILGEMLEGKSSFYELFQLLNILPLHLSKNKALNYLASSADRIHHCEDKKKRNWQGKGLERHIEDLFLDDNTAI